MDAESHALSSLSWILTDERRAARLLDMTGLTPEDLHRRIGERDVLAAVLGFLAAHEPDLIACAEATGTTPETLAAAGRALGEAA